MSELRIWKKRHTILNSECGTPGTKGCTGCQRQACAHRRFPIEQVSGRGSCITAGQSIYAIGAADGRDGARTCSLVSMGGTRRAVLGWSAHLPPPGAPEPPVGVGQKEILLVSVMSTARALRGPVARPAASKAFLS